jgi:hypothetical protein
MDVAVSEAVERAVARAMASFATLATASWSKIRKEMAEHDGSPCHFHLPDQATMTTSLEKFLRAFLTMKAHDTVLSTQATLTVNAYL